MAQGTLCFKKCHLVQETMRPQPKVLFLVLVLLLFSASPFLTTGQARSVHNTMDVDLFPQGSLTDAGQWSVGAETSFTQESATYSETMVADQRLTMLHTRPVHLDTLTVWSSTSPTNSNYSTGAPTVRARGQQAQRSS